MVTQKVFGINNLIKNFLPFISPTAFLYFLRKKSLEKKYKDKKLKIGLYSSIKNSSHREFCFYQ